MHHLLDGDIYLAVTGTLARGFVSARLLMLIALTAGVKTSTPPTTPCGGEYGGGGLSLSTEMIFLSSGYLFPKKTRVNKSRSSINRYYTNFDEQTNTCAHLTLHITLYQVKIFWRAF